jgi:hypothetical protein
LPEVSAGARFTFERELHGSIWNQTFSYDRYGNITKSSSGPGLSWMPGYNAATNRYTLTGTQYDANGNVIKDSLNTYKYDKFNKLISVNAKGANCVNGGQCITYDAFGQAVEVDSGGTNTEIWYTQLGKTAYMSGAQYKYSYVPAPGGATILDANDGYHFEHKDWLGNARIGSDIDGQTVLFDQAYAPFGEIYNPFGPPVRTIILSPAIPRTYSPRETVVSTLRIAS